MEIKIFISNKRHETTWIKKSCLTGKRNCNSRWEKSTGTLMHIPRARNEFPPRDRNPRISQQKKKKKQRGQNTEYEREKIEGKGSRRKRAEWKTAPERARKTYRAIFISTAQRLASRERDLLLSARSTFAEIPRDESLGTYNSRYIYLYTRVCPRRFLRLPHTREARRRGRRHREFRRRAHV